MTDPETLTGADTRRRWRRRWWLVPVLLVLATAAVSSVRAVLDRNAWNQADQACAEASRLSETGSPQQAQALLEGVLERVPHHVQARILLGRLLWEQDQPEQARAEWDRIGNTAGRDSAIVRDLEGAAWLAEDRTIPAQNKLRSAAEFDHQYLPPLERLTKLYSLQLRGVDLRRTLVQIRNERPLTFHELARGILADTSADDSLAALQRLQRFYAADPDDTMSRIAAARFQMRQGENQAALQTLDQSVRTNDAQLLTARALVLTRLDRLTEARSILARLAGQTPSPLLWRARGELLEKLENQPASIAALLTVATSSPFDTQLFRQLGEGLGREPDRQELAQAFLERADRLEILERDCRQILATESLPPEALAEAGLRIAEQLIALDHAAFAAEWLRQVRMLSPDDPRLESLSEQASADTPDTWGRLLTRAIQEYPQRLAERVSFSALTHAE